MLATTNIKKIALVEFPKNKCDVHESILDDCKVQHLEWMHNKDLPFPNTSEKNMSKGFHIAEEETVLVNLELCSLPMIIETAIA